MAEEFGLTGAAVEEAFREYRKRFGFAAGAADPQGAADS